MAMTPAIVVVLTAPRPDEHDAEFAFRLLDLCLIFHNRRLYIIGDCRLMIGDGIDECGLAIGN